MLRWTCFTLLCLVCSAVGDSDDLIRSGDKEFISGHYDKAIELYTDALNADSTNYRAYFKRATVYSQTRKYRQALFDLSQVLNLNSEYHLALQSRAKLHQEMGNWDESLEDLKKLKNLKPDLAAKVDIQIKEVATLKSLITEGDARLKASSWQEAKMFYTQLLDQASGMNSVRLKRALCSYKLGSYSEVIEDTMRILKVDKSNVDAISLRGNAFRQLGEVETAVNHYKSCIKFGSIGSQDCKTALQELEQFQANRNSAKTYSQQQHTAKLALELVEKSLQYVSTHNLDVFRGDIILTKCRALLQLKEAEKAIEACDSVGGNTEAHKLKGEAFILLQKYEEAVREYQKAVDAGDHSAQGGLQNAQRLLKISKRKDYYKILEIPNSASPKDIKRAYHKMALKWHPDKNPDQRELAEQKLTDINEANTVLSDPEKRGKYDRGEDLDERPGGNPFEGTPFHGFNFHFGRRG